MPKVAAIALPLLIGAISSAMAQGTLPNPVKTCADVNAYVTDRSMTMDRFKTLLTAAGADLRGGGEQALDNQCKATAYAKQVIMSQGILRKDDGGIVRMETKIINDNGVCRLTEISVSGC